VLQLYGEAEGEFAIGNSCIAIVPAGTPQ